MELLFKFLMANARVSLAKAVKGFVVGPMVTSSGMSTVMVKDVMLKTMAVVRGETVTYVDMDEQHAVEGLVGLISPLFSYYGLTLTEVEVEPLVVDIANLF